MSVTSCPDVRQDIMDLEDLEFELSELERKMKALKRGDWDSDICLAGGNRQENELLKLGRRAVRRLKRALGIEREQ